MTTDISDPTELLRWWHQYQAQMLTQEADFVRNGILQEIIAIRRRLEVSCPLQPHSTTSACAPQLADLSRLYSLLEGFCDRLQSPFIADSLPLALQHAVQPWQAPLSLQVQFPTAWAPDPLEQAQLLILLIKALLSRLATWPYPPQSSALTLAAVASCKTLTFQAQYAAPLDPALSPRLEQTLQPFLETFRRFAPAHAVVLFQPDGFSLKLGWESLSASSI